MYVSFNIQNQPFHRVAWQPTFFLIPGDLKAQADPHNHSSFALDTSCVVTVLVFVQVPGGSRIVSMILNRRGTRLLVNCYDRVVRLYETCQPGKRRRSYTAADLKTRLASAKVSHPCSCSSACFCTWLAAVIINTILD